MNFTTATPNPDWENVMDINPEELNNLDGDIQLIDVRQPAEYIGELGHIPGSNLLTLDLLPESINELDKTKALVFICRSGQRSAKATQFAQSAGFDQVYNMKGGMILWNQLGFDTEV